MSAVKLSDCYTATKGPALISGTQALVRLLLEQARLDREQGLNTRGLVSGYPGSPLGGLDLELARSKRFLDEDGIVFQPGINEELAATALWGSQHVGLYDQSEYDGVFALWYGKGPGLDRAMDALRHANHGGVAPNGGMVIAVGDDPMGKSSTLAYQSDQGFLSLGVPYFFPRSVDDIIPMGLKAFALSRHAGCVVGLKIVIDTADANAIIDTGALRPDISTPEPVPSVHIARHDPALLRETKLHQSRLPAVRQWQRQNNVNPIVLTPQKKTLGIIAVGKAAQETQEAFHLLGLDQPEQKGIGMMVMTMPYPIDAETMRNFAKGYDEILVIEEKRAFVEDQLARVLVNTPYPPQLSGKTTPSGQVLLPEYGELTVELIMAAIQDRAASLGIMTPAPQDAATPQLGNLPAVPTRTPYYCAGCPHNSSTKVGEGDIAGMGIGCHSISGFLTPDNITNFSQMGGEGAFWIGRAPFSSLDHTLQNMGDGTYTHSGYLGIRAAVAAGVNMTFKILYNDAVAMTGGQDAAGGSEPYVMAQQLRAEGVKKIAVVTDQIKTTKASGAWPDGVSFHHRRDLLAVQDDLSKIKGVTALLYVQTCAAELRRRRKRGKIADRAERLLINEAVCEGCGDCAVKSNCVAVKPVAHPDGIKRQIDQSTCNKDYSCNEGFCPSFVSIVPKGNMASAERPSLPEGKTLPAPSSFKPGISNIYIAGIGGTGVSTLSAMLVMAARLDGHYAQAVNNTGLSQKNGGVTAQLRMSPDTSLKSRMVRLPPRSADLLLGCDAVVAANDQALKSVDPDRTTAIINARVDPVGVAGVGTGQVVDDQLLLNRFDAVVARERLIHRNVSAMADRLLGSTTTANVMLLGMAVQKGLIPVSVEAMEEALRLNGVAVDDNIKAFTWGRWLAHDPDQVMAAAAMMPVALPVLDDKPAHDAVAYFAERLTEYQNKAYAERYRHIMQGVMDRVAAFSPEDDRLARKAARAVYRLMAIKDEYEVARLMTSSAFKDTIDRQFGGAASLHYNLAPPLLGFLKNRDGTPKKFRIGSWMGAVFKVLAVMKPLRGTVFDCFGYGRERRREWAFRDDHLRRISQMASTLDAKQADEFDAVLEALLTVRGYGHIKSASMDAAEASLAGMAMVEKADDLLKKAS